MKYLADFLIWVGALATVLLVGATGNNLLNDPQLPPMFLSKAAGLVVIVSAPFVMGLLLRRYRVIDEKIKKQYTQEEEADKADPGLR